MVRYNFSAGPSTMPKDVLERAQRELLNWHDLHVSVMEISHRSEEFIELAKRSQEKLRELYHIPHNYKILFAQGGARGQFAAVPMNLLSKTGKALYINSGHWSHLAAQEARKFGEIDEIDVIDHECKYTTLKSLDFAEQAKGYDYVHYCPNETVNGIEIFEPPKVGNAVLVADMSSCIMSRKIDIKQFGLIYAGAQKNLGPAGITIIIIREDLLERSVNKLIPSVWDYKLLDAKDSMVNTPPTFAWYLCTRVFSYWLNHGGIMKIEDRNRQKAKLLYNYITESKFYSNYIDPKYRSMMNVVFTTGDADLDLEFARLATENGLIGLKGHKAVGGLRASIYNAMPIEGVEALLEFMDNFAKQYSSQK